jgi:hypothetical protein
VGVMVKGSSPRSQQDPQGTSGPDSSVTDRAREAVLARPTDASNLFGDGMERGRPGRHGKTDASNPHGDGIGRVVAPATTSGFTPGA